MTDDELIGEVLEREGGATFTNNPADRGGPTKYGITAATLAQWRQKPVLAADVAALTEEEARAIYRRRYIEDPGFDKIGSEALRAVLVDAGVNHGPRTAVKFLQRALAIQDDGILGPVTLQVVNLRNGLLQLAIRVLAQRTRFFGRMISKNLTDADRDGIPDNTEFAAGWLDRIADQLEELT